MYYAKSNPRETLKEHTDELVNQIKYLKEISQRQVAKITSLEDNEFWRLLEIACKYHDTGKIFTPFQNLILNKIEEKEIPTEFNYNDIKHEQLSPALIPIDDLDLTEQEEKLLVQAIYYHHERKQINEDRVLINKIIKNDLMPKLESASKELEIKLNKDPNTLYLSLVGDNKRINSLHKLYIDYVLLKGFLHRLDYSASAHIQVEDTYNEKISDYIEEFFKQHHFIENELQEFAKDNQENNVVAVGSTGLGKTEAALLWAQGDKAFFTLPLRISINAIFDRIKDVINYKSVGLLHSTAFDYLEEAGTEFEISNEEWEQSKNLSYRITTCTIDQIFPFVFKYKGYERIYSTLAYSKVIIDEIQAYDPEITAIILKGLQMINNIGGKFMIMTATLPRIYKDKLEEMKINFEYKEVPSKLERHKIKIEKEDILDSCEIISEKGKNKKVLVIANTVNKAIEIYKKMLEENNENVHLLHARFIAKDRAKLEKEIKEFSDNKEKNGVWITTQLVEASLDIDFDYLYTEMSTLDSLFQRLGRCYRKRKFDMEEPNVYIFTENNSGIGSVYDKKIYEISKELLENYDSKILEEKQKMKLVDELYSEEKLKNSKFLEKFEDGMKVLDNIIDYDVDKKEAQQLLRKIESYTVIPKSIYDENMELFDEYRNEKDREKKRKFRREINKLTTNISSGQMMKVREYVVNSIEIEGIKVLNLKYDNKTGLLLEDDEDYDSDSRFL